VPASDCRFCLLALIDLTIAAGSRVCNEARAVQTAEVSSAHDRSIPDVVTLDMLADMTGVAALPIMQDRRKPDAASSQTVLAQEVDTADMGTITTKDGTQVSYKDWGPTSAQPMVFHHGWPSSVHDGPRAGTEGSIPGRGRSWTSSGPKKPRP
jgi:hypothetical protein